MSIIHFLYVILQSETEKKCNAPFSQTLLQDHSDSIMLSVYARLRLTLCAWESWDLASADKKPWHDFRRWKTCGLRSFAT